MTAVSDPVEVAADILGVRARRGVPLGSMTTYRVGGAASVAIEIGDERDLELVTEAVRRSGVEVLLVGKGSNLLVADVGFHGLAILLGEGFSDIAIEGTAVRAGGGASLPVVARRTAGASLTGFEWAVGIPGSVGGAVRMNAGGHGSEMAEVLERVRVVDVATGDDCEMTAQELELGYRRSCLGRTQLVVWADLRLEPGDRADAQERIAQIVSWRRENQPGGANAGSVFVNPEGSSAGELIDRCGAKGRRRGSARVSEKHANFIIVDEAGSADDVLELMREVRDAVQAHSGVRLYSETRLIGFAGREADLVAPGTGGDTR